MNLNESSAADLLVRDSHVAANQATSSMQRCSCKEAKPQSRQAAHFAQLQKHKHASTRLTANSARQSTLN
jgi:hypothetical protein